MPKHGIHLNPNHLCVSCGVRVLPEFKKRKILFYKCGNCSSYQIENDKISFDESQYNDNYFRKTKSPIKEMIRSFTIFRSRLNYIQKYCKHGRLMDVGTGPGDFLVQAKKRGYEAFGVEISSTGVKRARNKNKFQIYHWSITNDIPDKLLNVFDVITAWDIIGHVDNPIKAIRNMHRMLRSHGMLFLSLPNPGSVDARILKKEWYIFYPERIFFYFSREGIKIVLNKNGFKVLEILTPGVPSYIFPFNYLPLNSFIQCFTLKFGRMGSSIFTVAQKA